MRGIAVSTALTAAVALASLVQPAAADPVADFYRGKTIPITHTGGAGGTFAACSRLLAEYMAGPAFKADAAKRRPWLSPPMNRRETTDYVHYVAALPKHVIDAYKAAIE